MESKHRRNIKYEDIEAPLVGGDDLKFFIKKWSGENFLRPNQVIWDMDTTKHKLFSMNEILVKVLIIQLPYF